MSDIKLNIKLSAYSKGVIPDVSNYLTEAPEDGKLYGRKDKQWEVIPNQLTNILTDENSGIKIDYNEDNTINISAKQFTGKEDEIAEFQNDYTYYIVENTPDLYINGGTAYSDEENEFEDTVKGGNASTSSFELNTLPIDSKGVYNG